MPLYSNSYIQDLKNLHSRKDRPRGFGGKVKPLGAFYSYFEKWKPTTALDYGCGKAAILQHLSEKYPRCNWQGYDPAVEHFSKIQLEHYDCVFSNDVLEHIEPDYLHDVLDHIWTLGTKYIWLCIDTLPARKTLTDGRNAHLIIESREWWFNILDKRPGTIVYNELGKKGKFYVAIER
jgi:hypothetical protein